MVISRPNMDAVQYPRRATLLHEPFASPAGKFAPTPAVEPLLCRDALQGRGLGTRFSARHDRGGDHTTSRYGVAHVTPGALLWYRAGEKSLKDVCHM